MPNKKCLRPELWATLGPSSLEKRVSLARSTSSSLFEHGLPELAICEQLVHSLEVLEGLQRVRVSPRVDAEGRVERVEACSSDLRSVPLSEKFAEVPRVEQFGFLMARLPRTSKWAEVALAHSGVAKDSTM